MTAASEVAARVPVSIITPKTLRAAHVGYVLANGLRCVFVQDPNAKVPAAAMCIRAGQLNDPPQLPGLAHFCEHMLFMGTAKFPREDEYDNYISKSNGFDNAWTAGRATTYYFEVGDDALDGALERFVEFFVSPSFNESAVSREVKAVHSEDEKNHSVDYWRVDELHRSLFNSKHPRSRYGNGNITTLHDEPMRMQLDVRAELQNFYSRYYCAEAACMVVYSSHAPEEILKVVEPPLARMKMAEPAGFHFLERNEELFSAAAKHGWVNVRTVRKVRQVCLSWPVRVAASTWRSMPCAYISHILGHECDSSILGVLKRRGMVTGMVAGPQRIDDDFEVFSVELSLTTAGFVDLDEVISVVYQGIGLAIAGGIDRSVYAQMKAEERLRFESSEVSSASNHCVKLAATAIETDLEHCWIGGEMVLDDDFEASMNYAKQLVPDSCVVTLKWSELPCTAAAAEEEKLQAGDNSRDEVVTDEEDEEECGAEAKPASGDQETSADDLFAALPSFAQVKAGEMTRFHKTPFALTHVPAEYRARWTKALGGPYTSELGLPAVNPYLATDFTVYPKAADTATVAEFTSEHGVTLIRKDAGHHNTFKSAITWGALSPAAYATPRSRFYARIMSSILQHALTEMTYFGELASCENTITCGPGGLGVTVVGPYQSLGKFFHDLLAAAVDLEVLRGSEELFKTYAEKLVRALESQSANQPYALALDRFSKLITPVCFTFEEMLAEAPDATYSGYTQFAEAYLSSGLLFECVITGNMPSSTEMRDLMVGTVEQLLSTAGVPVPLKSSIPRFRDAFALEKPVEPLADALASVDVISFPPFNPADPNVSVMLDVSPGRECARTRALCDCAVRLISSAFFNALRTREALGYVVFAATQNHNGTAHIMFTTQSALPTVDGPYLLSRIFAFLSAIEASLDAVCSEASLQTVTSGLIMQRAKLPDSVARDAAMLRADILHPEGLLRREKEVECLRQLSVEDVKMFMRRFILNSRTEVRALAFIINNRRTAAASVLSPGTTETLQLPPQLPVESEAVPSADGESEGALVLPSFSQTPAYWTARSWSTLEEYQQGLRTIQSHTF